MSTPISSPDPVADALAAVDMAQAMPRDPADPTRRPANELRTLRHLADAVRASYLASPKQALRSEWVCVVLHAYHNGPPCTPGDPHDGWECGYRFHLLLPADGPGKTILLPGGIA